jgi:flagellar hook-basal body complex protein FliE
MMRSPERVPSAAGASGTDPTGLGGLGGLDPSSLADLNPSSLAGMDPSTLGGVNPSSFAQTLGSIPGVTPGAATPAASDAASIAGGQPVSFGNILSNAINEVNSKMQAADAAKTQVLTGETTNVHQAMIAMQESSVAFGLMVEVRNKLVDSFQELMRMQV